WPVALVMTWLSRRWATRDKVAVTAALLVAFLLFLSTTMVAAVSYTSGSAQVTTQSIDGSVQTTPEMSRPVAAPGAPSPWLQLLGIEFAFLGLYGAPLASGIYLATRMRPRPRRPRDVALATGATLLAVALVAAFLGPVQYATTAQRGNIPLPVQQVEVATPTSR
ncbi:MAG: hypothetical protein ACYC7H_02295, partial [Chloroflexota bacterium]